jgi:hypothetical protein
MNLLQLSAIYNAGETSLLFRILYLFCAILLALVVERWLPAWLARLCRLGVRVLSAFGIATSCFLLYAEWMPLGLRCPLCAVADVGLATVFIVSFARTSPKTSRAALVALAVSAAICFAYLIQFGSIPQLRRLAAAPPVPEWSPHRGEGKRLTIVEFADFQCHPCAMQEEVMESVVNRYRTQVRFVYRHLPLNRIHPYATKAAIASECAAFQGLFWKTERTFFRQQDNLPALLDSPLQASCIADGSAARRVAQDVDDARSLGLHATPSIIVGTMVAVGLTPASRLMALIDSELRDNRQSTSDGVFPAAASRSAGCSVGRPACGE